MTYDFKGLLLTKCPLCGAEGNRVEGRWCQCGYDFAAQAQLRARSGSVDHTSRLVSFLYSLMRNHLPAGAVEGLVQEASNPNVRYTNGWLANYAIDLAKRLEEGE